MKHIIDEGIKNKAKFENIPPLTQDEVKGALDFIIKKTAPLRRCGTGRTVIRGTTCCSG